MRVFHGGYSKIVSIDLVRCEPRKDFGQGFYVTKFKQHAEDWAVKKSKFKHNGFVTEFEFEFDNLTTRNCKIKHFDSYDEGWLDFVVLNPNHKANEPAHDYDIVEGPIADDKIQKRLDSLLRGNISKAEFLQSLIYHEETHQICFCTFGSLNYLHHIDRNTDLKIADIGETIVEKLISDFNFDVETASEKFFSSVTFAQLSDETIKGYNKDWTGTYKLLLEELKLK